MQRNWKYLGWTLFLGGFTVMVTVAGAGCGMIADQDRLVVAEIDGKEITRGDLLELIYDMPDDERPIIRSTRDYERVLNAYIDQQIKRPLGQRMAAEGTIEVDRDAARERFFQSKGDEEEQYRRMWSIPVPEPGEETELMQIYNLGAAEIQAMKNIIEQETDKIVEKMQADRAVQHLAMEAFQAGELELDEEAVRMEYEMRKEDLKSLESITFLGLQFPAADPSASEEAARVRERLDSGEDFDKVLNEYLARDMSYGVESQIENNPEVARFQTFWQQVSGAEEGQILGPIFMPEYKRMRQGDNGQMVEETVPASYLVFKVLEHQPAETLPLEQALPYIAAPIAYAEMMEKLREEHGVQVYDENLPDVRGGDQDIFAG